MMDERDMAILGSLRETAREMGIKEGKWKWIGPHMSQRHFGITKEHAQSLAKRYGGEASLMEEGAA
tara:strand:+ start:1925 stop:2122 length:198 start_codon:yes stop_codon:yes gene_type:complete